MKGLKPVLYLLCIWGLLAIISGPASANSIQIRSMGQSVYVPVYSHIYHGDKGQKFDLTVTLSIRNTNLKQAITVQSIDYFDSDGRLLKNYLDAPIELKEFSTIRHVIKAKDRRGGSGAKFIVRWCSEKLSNAPLIEAIMISTQSQQGISFVSRGQAIHE